LSTELASLKAHEDWVAGATWTLQVTVSSTCTSNALLFGFSYEGGTHIISVAPNANGEVVTVVDQLNSRTADNFFQARSGCSASSSAVVTFSSVLMGPGDVRTALPTETPTSPPSREVIVSAATCAELGWTNAFSLGSTSVCGESDLGLGGCSGVRSFANALAFCEAPGARLCTVEELQNDEVDCQHYHFTRRVCFVSH
jgi:hypothetical protein